MEFDRTHLPSGPSRRGVVRAAAWAVPAVSLVTAAPSSAATTTGQWTVASQSFEGWPDGSRSDFAETYQMRFTMTVPAGVTIVAPQLFVQLSGGRGGNTWHEDDDIWSLSRTDGNAGWASAW